MEKTIRERYLYIAKQSLSGLTKKGFHKKGMNFSLEKGELILDIHAKTPRPWLKFETFYEFLICWDLSTTNKDLLNLYHFMEPKEDQKKIPLISLVIRPDSCQKGMMRIEASDSIDIDQKMIIEIQEKIDSQLLPWFKKIISFDEVVNIAEEEITMERQQREYFGDTNIYYILCTFYAVKGWRNKFYEMCDKYIENSITSSRYIAEEKVKKLIKYFESEKLAQNEQ